LSSFGQSPLRTDTQINHMPKKVRGCSWCGSERISKKFQSDRSVGKFENNLEVPCLIRNPIVRNLVLYERGTT
ncbi:MAG TPA: hypothetical protein VIT23_01915, partial [Terrimicrobiaceae bacterium]